MKTLFLLLVESQKGHRTDYQTYRWDGVHDCKVPEKMQKAGVRPSRSITKVAGLGFIPIYSAEACHVTGNMVIAQESKA